jgi:hypothetical protein
VEGFLAQLLEPFELRLGRLVGALFLRLRHSEGAYFAAG